MMKPLDELLARLRILDIQIYLDGDRLRVNAPKGGISPELRQEMQEHKDELLAFLKETQQALVHRAPDIKKVSRALPQPLSFAQQRLWFLRQFEGPSPTYNIPLALVLLGELHVAAIERAINEVLRRHEILRTTFRLERHEPVQVIQPATPLPIIFHDLQALPEVERSRQTQALMVQEARTLFDLENGPLLKVMLIKLDAEEHLLMMTMHHIISDGWSMELITRELASLYNAYRVRDTSPLNELNIHYVDFAVWQRHRMQGEILQEGLAFWRQQLANTSGILELPLDKPRPAVQTFNGAIEYLCLGSGLSNDLTQFSQRQGVTLFMVLIAGFAVLLHRYSGQQDFIIGSPIANRNFKEVEPLIGFFSNTLALRMDTSGDPTFLEFLRRVQSVSVDAFEHQDIPFEKLVEDLHPERDLSYSPLFQVLFTLQNAPLKWEFNGLSVSQISLDNGTSKFDLSLSITPAETGFSGTLTYNTDLFHQDTICRMLGHLQILFESILEDPTKRISQLTLMSEEETRQVLVTWNDTRTNYPQLCAHELFSEQAQRTPERLAVYSDSEQLTYRELDERSNSLAHYLRGLGVGREKLVGLYMERTPGMMVALMGILKAGGAYVPLDPSYPAERLAFIIEDAQLSLIVSEQKIIQSLPSDVQQVITAVDMVCVDCDWETISKKPSNYMPLSGVTSSDLVYVMYTSGSTGKPKGVMIEHRSVVNFWNGAMRVILDRYPGPLKVTQNSPLLFDASVKEWTLLLSGHSLYIVSEDIRLDGVGFLSFIRKHQLDVLRVVPSQMKVLLDVGILDDQGWVPPIILLGGEAIDSGLWQKLLSRDDIDSYNMYGPTETTINASYCSLRDHPSGPVIGWPIQNARYYVLDSLMQPVPIGIVGELYIGGDVVGRGYWNRPELTPQRFLNDPNRKTPGARMYRTGDLVRFLPDGLVQFLGRADNQVKVRGYRIELEEIEKVLLAYQGVKDAAVIAREDTPGDVRLVAYFVASQPLDHGASELYAYLSGKLPHFMLPTAYVRMEKIPRMPHGKIDRRALPLPDKEMVYHTKAYTAPRNPAEEVLARIWGDVLGIARVGVFDNFFEIGGHSLLVTQLLLKIRDVFQVDLPLRQLFENSTIAGLADYLAVFQKAGGKVSGDGGPSLDLEVEAQLDEQIQSNTNIQDRSVPGAHTGSVLLTGATGFVGSNLLADLLQNTSSTVRCLMRGSDATAAGARLQAELIEQDLWKPEYAARIQVIPGDLEQPLFGLGESEFYQLASTTDMIFHAGAWVNFVAPYETLKRANVQGTVDILRLATTAHQIPIHYMSTLSVFHPESYAHEQVIDELTELRHGNNLVAGYPQSKYVADRMMLQAGARGVPVSIYRFGTVVAHTQSGFWSRDAYIPRFIKGCIQLGAYPDLNQTWRLLPVDYIARAIVLLATKPVTSQSEMPGAQIRHIVAPQQIEMQRLMDWMRNFGYNLQTWSYFEWLDALVQTSQDSTQNALYPLIPLFLLRGVSDIEQNLQFDDQKTRAAIESGGLASPQINQLWLSKAIQYFRKVDFLPAPVSHSLAVQSN